jgi:ribonuclease P protein component
VLDVSAVRLGDAVEPPRVAYAVSRRVGNAVVRNRVRRRLRAAALESVELLQPGWGYLVGARPEAAGASYAQLTADLTGALQAHHNGASA